MEAGRDRNKELHMESGTGKNAELYMKAGKGSNTKLYMEAGTDRNVELHMESGTVKNTKFYMKNRHLTEENIRHMLQNRFSAEETTEMQNHLAQCTYCADLIAKVMEEGYLVAPPPDMKEHILRKSKNIRKRKEYSKKMQLLFYSLRVGIAMCFTLILLFATDRKMPEAQQKTMQEKAGFQLEVLNHINRSINEVTTKIITMEGIENDTKKE